MLFARRFVLVLMLALLSLAPARANPMLLVDMDNFAVLYAEDAGQPWHPASLTKLMTAYVAFDQIALGKVSLDTPVVISRKAFNQAPSKSGLAVGSAVTLQDALYLLLVKSANDVAVAIAETIAGDEASYVALMNDTAARMGLTATHYANANGLHDPAQVTSARDLAILSLYIRQTFPQYMPIFGTATVMLNGKKLESENKLLETFAGTTGMKTGFICASGLNMVATVDRNGRRLLAVILGGASARDRNERTAELILRGLSGAATPTGQTVLTLGNNPGALPVDMRSQICGKEAKAYVASQEAAFPMGLKGQPSFLTDTVLTSSYVATDLGRIAVGVSLPRPRPAHLPIFSEPTTEAALDGDLRPGLPAAMPGAVPFPRPRPNF
ncbi:D-alanyl-D-alanine carboxypeptidase family protein [Devosia ginsengisoli]|uniref:D-alanyl-D-alanine carboxypeptidase family protein n=1 Tax=Devosia ginsengisoli TaxID=400770 RepID=UPI0026F1B4CE|nr:D-alanyl-D-alanine carboxypeptidase family protein [Devosia ginsengisoli]MCR6672230.1 D-alanyl-D-alanine carboxypeptidase [Devosia ginsengisoli]